MSIMVRGVEEEVFETPDPVEDDTLEAGMLAEWTAPKKSSIPPKEVRRGRYVHYDLLTDPMSCLSASDLFSA